MLLIFIIILFILLLITYYLFKRDIFSPSVITIAMFLFSSFFSILNKDKWFVNFRIETFFIIFLGILLIFLGELIVRMIFRNKHRTSTRRIRNEIPIERVYVKRKWTIFVILILIFFFIYRLIYIYRVVGMHGFQETLLGSYRGIVSSEYIEQNIFIKLIDIISPTIAYFYMYIYIKNKIYGFKISSINLIPVFLYFAISTLSSGRIQYIFFIIFTLVIWYILLQNRYDWKYTFSKKFIKVGIFTVLLFLISFYFLGYLTGKSKGKELFDYISIYAGGSIPALNLYLQHYEYDINNFGSTTLIGINNLIKYLGFDGFETNRNLEFIFIGPLTRTNVYTGFGRLLHDFNYIGVVIFFFFIGIIYTTIYMKIKYKYYQKNEDFKVFLYSFIYFPIVLQPIDETFFKNLISVTVITQFFIFHIFFAGLRRNNPRKL